MKERLQKIMARANLGSRRGCEELIEQKRVRVNGVVAQLGEKADPTVDVIEVDGVKISFKDQRKIYVALNKPINVLTTNLANHKDRRQTVRDLIVMEGHLFSIGRLDAESEGLIVMTNDGELVQRLTHPKYRHTKTYKVSVYGLPTLETLERWRSGIFLQDEDGTTYKTAPCSVEILKGDRELTTLRVVMTEGRKRQIRRVASSLGHPVQKLVRTHIGKLELGTLRPGEWRELTGKEVNALSMPADEIEGIVQRKHELNKRRRFEQDDQGNSPRGARPFRPPSGGRNKPLIGGSKPRRPRSEGDDEDRPRSSSARPSTGGYRPDGDKPRRPRSADDRGERPRRDDSSPFQDRSPSSDRPRRPRPDDAAREDERPRRPRPDSRSSDDRSQSSDRPRRPRSADDRGERPRRDDSSPFQDRSPSSDRPRRPRPDDASREDERPRRPRPAAGEPRRDNDTPSERSEDRPRKPRTSRPAPGGQGKPRKPGGKRPASGGQGKPRRPRKPRPQ